MWIYNIRQGTITSPDGEVEGHGYSGQPQYKNDPTAVAIHNEGPIPPGRYTMSTFFHSEGPRYKHPKGKYVCQLIPALDNNMFKRAGFMIHGDSISEPGTASDGCIIQGRATRISMAMSDDHDLLVITGDETPEQLAELGVKLGGPAQQHPDSQATA